MSRHHSCPAFLRLFCCILIIVAAASGATIPSSIGLSSSFNPVALSQPLTLTASVTAGASGKVTFYDGTVILGIGTLAAGKVTFTTTMLASGAHSLRAYYGGDANYFPSSSAPLPQTVTTVPTNGFSPAVSTPIGFPLSGRYLPAAADFNGDGKADLVVPTPNANPGSSVSVLLGNGDGTFRSPAGYTTGIGPIAVAVGDFNGDGKPDLAVSSYGDLTVSILLGKGDGTFQPAIVIPAGMRTLYISVGDFNGDGKVDLVLAQRIFMGILLGNGDGTFQPVTSISAGFGDTAWVAVGDFNGDGKADLAAARDSFIGIFLGNGDGTMQPMTTYPAGQFPVSLTVADLNGDGKPDLAVANGASAGASSVSVLLGNGDGTFQPAVQYAALPNTSFVAVADLNGDGKADLIPWNNTTASMLAGNGDGTFGPAKTLWQQDVFSSVMVADFNGDGKADVAVAGTPINVLLSGKFPDLAIGITHSQNFAPGSSQAYNITVSNLPFAPANGLITVTESVPPGVTATSIFGPGWNCTLSTLTCTRSDSLEAGTSYLPIVVMVQVANNAPAILTNTATVAGGGEVNSDNDRAVDTVVIRTAVVMLSSGPNPAVFGQPVTLTATVTPGATGQVTFYDGVAILGVSPLGNGRALLTTRLLTAGSHTMNARYNPDAASLSPAGWANASQTVTPVASNGFQPVATYPVPASDQVVMADFNGDGNTDLALNASPGVTVLPGNGDGTFRPAISSPGGQEGPMAVADFNGDGVPDLVRASYDGMGNGSVIVLLGNGNGTFRSGWVYKNGNDVSNVAVADFNGDGKADIAFTLMGSANLGVLLGNGDGSFQVGANYNVSDYVDHPTGDLGLGMAVADFNGDGNADVALATGLSGITVLLGNGDGTLRRGLSHSVQCYCYFLVAGDFNGDGRPDLALANSSVNAMLLLGKGDGTFQDAAQSYSGTLMAAGDWNGDGKLDLVLLAPGNDVQVLAVLAGKGDGSFQAPVMMSSGGLTRAVAMGDLNGDGRIDLAMANDGSGNAGVVLGSGTPTVKAVFSQIGVYRPTSAAANTAAMAFFLDSNGSNSWEVTDKIRFFGNTAGPAAAQDIAVAGDWDGTGVVRFGVFHCAVGAQCTWYIDLNNDGQWGGGDAVWANFGLPGDTPVVGDWTGDGKSKIGVFRCPTAGQPGECYWILDLGNKHTYDPATVGIYRFGLPGDQPAVGNWKGGAADQVGVMHCPAVGASCTWIVDSLGKTGGPNQGVYDPADSVFTFTAPGGFMTGDVAVVGSWFGNVGKRVGIFRSSTGKWYVDTNGNGVYDSLFDQVFSFGLPATVNPFGIADQPVVGNWTMPGNQL